MRSRRAECSWSSSRCFWTSQRSIPTTDAVVAATMNIIVTGASSDGQLSVKPAGVDSAQASVVSYSASSSSSVLSIPSAGLDGLVSIDNNGGGTVHVTVSTEGVFVDGSLDMADSQQDASTVDEVTNATGTGPYLPAGGGSFQSEQSSVNPADAIPPSG